MEPLIVGLPVDNTIVIYITELSLYTVIDITLPSPQSSVALCPDSLFDTRWLRSGLTHHQTWLTFQPDPDRLLGYKSSWIFHYSIVCSVLTDLQLATSTLA
jgi:hypothetical protein